MPVAPALAQSIRALPKVELHVHLEGFVDLSFWRAMTQAQGTWTEQRDLEMAQKFGFQSFPLFLKCFGAVIFSFMTPGDFYLLTQKALADLKSQGVVYGELMFTPAFFVDRGINFPEIMAEIDRAAKEAEREGGPKLALIFDGARNFGTQAVQHCFDLAAADPTGRVIGVGLGGDEVHFPAQDFVAQFAWAKAQGFRLTCHAGEAAGEDSIAQAVELLGAERIGHALGLTPGGPVEELVLSKGVALDLCPHSNLTTGVLADLNRHPFLAYRQRGHKVSLNSDDPGFFKTSLLKEYLWAAESLGLTLEDLTALSLAALDQSFLAAPEKRRFQEKLTSAQL
ncbi:MAG: hypothetical protein A2600_11085 [Candidatus Lambdaproteobacteria bacterium RIFOXYD1_FULL_56_27]|uniref:Adenosine deaminase domain-containing protein n=1 Tax=Candidatus Lambdaproteobacteria bacterium RIFOXYD2_FULL_56_26 TaxID=1817773 RepID=A0A1F6H1M9_9PROT|nr:MAG: hypothetical protein A2557_10830 [Candidatus Lambdaproteobacteria bacterium RIFOXYD2_FULL_56_26]OGH05686.1 MAG: hypothetical protein A2426_04100 [Candidatus Lambdaproteobacteria bacterium RIFOXYC1_FULL_56_13]OGH08447.1 MAG: hypothetical protein A2600_11085 [Candidatus Lambdaproteobacteria bacterium RIFOXYD1_FULL_56_27]